MSDNDLKQSIASTLVRFGNGGLADNARDLFNVLGYRSDKTAKLASSSPQAFVATFKGSRTLNEKNALLTEWTSAELIFQLTSAEVAHTGQRSLFEGDRHVDNRIIESYLFLAIGLRGEAYSRTQLAAITREVNKIFPMPALILFKHGTTLTLAVIDRRLHERDESKDVLEKVTLIKDIRIASPHRAHLEILFDLSLDELHANFDIANWVQLHDAWRKTLDTSELNKKFFREVANWYYWAQSKCKFPKGAGNNDAERNAISVIRMLTRLIFVWFVKEKNLIPDELFDEREIKNLTGLGDLSGLDSTYYKAILQNLFFATLSTEMNKDKPKSREYRHEPDAHHVTDDYLVPNKYRYSKCFRNPQAFLDLCSNIPFLNGGLFECLDREVQPNELTAELKSMVNREGNHFVLRIDGFSEREDNQVVVPNELFFGRERDIDLNDTFGTKNKTYRVRGLIHTFNQYKFTVDENTPIEEEIALDPELLGKVFENLLAAYNPETGITARKQTGSFYTPREIVNYMVDESLKAYLQNQTGLDDLSGLLAYNEEPHGFSDAQVAKLIDAVDRLKALDPAAGSGAFPMGLLHKLVYVLRKIDPDNARWKATQLALAQSIADAKERVTVLDDIADAFANDADYARKLYVIENCLYGVDIQPIAVQICKLRCFISLIVDDKVDDTRPNRGIRPLPNLETKFVAANSLIGIERPQNADQTQTALASGTLTSKQEKLRDELVEVLRQYLKTKKPEVQKKYLASGEEIAEELNRAFLNVPGFTPINANWVFTTARSVDDLIEKLPGAKQAQATEIMFRSSDVEQKEKQLAEVRQRHFRARTRKTKEECRKQDEKLRAEIAVLLKKSGWGDETAEKLATWNPYDQNTAAGFFDAGWMFDVRNGFDIVIGNPPYLRVQGIQQNQPEAMSYYRDHFQSAQGSFDLYAVFIERGYQLLDAHGQFAFIVPHKFFQAAFGEGLRRLLTKRGALRQITRFGSTQVFEEATTYTCLLFLSAESSTHFDLLEVKTLTHGEEVLQAARQRVAHPDYAYSRLDAPKLNGKQLDWDFAVGEHRKVLDRMRQHPHTLGDLVRKIFQGLATSADDIYVLEVRKERKESFLCYSKQLDEEVEIERGLVKPFLMGKDVHRYEPAAAPNVVLFPYIILNGKAELMSQNYVSRQFPLGWKYLKRNQTVLANREHGRFSDDWHAFSRPQNLNEFATQKIITPEIALGCQMTLDTEGVFYHTTKVYSFVFKPEVKQSNKYLLGVLNSKVLWYFLTNTGYVLRGGYYTFKTDYLKPFPIASSTPEQEHAIETLVDYVLYLKAQSEPSAKDAAAERRLMAAYFEQLIDALVYELYFPEEFSGRDKQPSRLLNPTQLPYLKELRGNKITALGELFQTLYDRNHPVRGLVFFLDTIETVRIIEAKSKPQ